MTESVILRDDNFHLCNQKKDHCGIRCTITLTKSTLTVSVPSGHSNGDQQVADIVLHLEDVIGCLCTKSQSSDRGNEGTCAVLVINMYSLSKTFCHNLYRKKETLTLRCKKHATFEENWNEVLRLRDSIMSIVWSSSATISPKLLIFVNPNSGSGVAVKTFDSKIRYFLEEAGIDYQLVITEYSGHCYKFIQDATNLRDYKGIVAVSGDGMLYEIYNGLINRSDWQSITDIPIGVIPCGSGNGLARSLAHFNQEPYLYDPLVVSILNVVKLRTTGMDLCLVNTASNPKICSFLSIGWGLLSDIDIESERLRLLGEARFTVWALARVFSLRTYNGTLSYLPADGWNSDEPVVLPPLTEPLSETNWVVQSGRFVCVYSCTAPYIGTDVYIAPESKLTDGIIWLVIVKAPISSFQAAQFLLALDNGKHTQLPFVQCVPVKAFRLIPEITANHNSYLTVDGEQLDPQPVQAQVMSLKGSIFLR